MFGTMDHRVSQSAEARFGKHNRVAFDNGFCIMIYNSEFLSMYSEQLNVLSFRFTDRFGFIILKYLNAF